MANFTTDYVVTTPNCRPIGAKFLSNSDSLADHISKWNSAKITHIGPAIHGRSKFAI